MGVVKGLKHKSAVTKQSQGSKSSMVSIVSNTVKTTCRASWGAGNVEGNTV